MTVVADARYFAAIYRDEDPFGYRSRWYEARKRALLLAMLPQARHARAWEIGCSNGEATAALATRCDRLLATDLDPTAAALARQRTAALGNVEVSVARQPAQWPAGDFDLVVFSEVGYYLDPDALDATCRGIASRLQPGGTVLACHWRAPFVQARSAADAVHAALSTALGLAPTQSYLDADVRIDAWSLAPGSVAQREGLR